MELEQLPDLSHWRYIEVWTIEEFAMIWAAIDPMEHLNIRLQNMKGIVPGDQYIKALSMQRAISEAVCSGALEFVEAWELHDDYQNGEWHKEIDFPDLPSHGSIIPYRVRVKQAALRKWAEIKKILSMRQYIQQSHGTNLRTIEAAVQSLERVDSVTTLALAAPSYLDPAHPRFSAKLNAAVLAWQNVGEPSPGRTTKQAITEWVNTNAESLGLIHEGGTLIKSAIEEITAVVNWNKKGGAPKTPG